MKYKNVQGIKLSNMTMGTVQFGLNYGIANEGGRPDEDKVFDMLGYALDSGVTSLDTARYYGEAEARMGRFFKRPEFKGELPYITTKLRVGADNMADEAAMERSAFESVETSLKMMQLPKVNCVMLHDPKEMLAGGDALARVMRSLIDRGYTNEVGCSVYVASEIDAMLTHSEYTVTQLPMSLFDQRMIYLGAMKKLADRDITVFVRSVFLQGVFFLDPDKVDDPLLIQYAVPHIRALRAFAAEEGMSIAQFAISFIRDTVGVTSLVLGADTREQVCENISLMEGPAISEGMMRKVEKAFHDVDITNIMQVLARPKPQP